MAIITFLMLMISLVALRKLKLLICQLHLGRIGIAVAAADVLQVVFVPLVFLGTNWLGLLEPADLSLDHGIQATPGLSWREFVGESPEDLVHGFDEDGVAVVEDVH